MWLDTPLHTGSRVLAPSTGLGAVTATQTPGTQVLVSKYHCHQSGVGLQHVPKGVWRMGVCVNVWGASGRVGGWQAV